MNALSTTPAGLHWGRIGFDAQHGVALALFSLRTRNSCGIGEYLDLLPLIPWLRQNHLQILQLLPLNDSGQDSSPYNGISAYALNPIHLSLYDLPGIQSDSALFQDVQQMQKRALPQYIDYSIRREKNALLKAYLEKYQSSICCTSDYVQFVESRPWLKPFTVFKALKDKNDWSSWTDWPAREKMGQEIDILFEENKPACLYHECVQYLCHQQMRLVKKKADEHGVKIMGDLPILISIDSADVWHQSHLFDLNKAAGSPPDIFSQEGQYWGFPLYRWDRIEQKDFGFWKARLKNAAEYYHLYRLDHVAGFFRIWSILRGGKAREGSYLPQSQNLWLMQGKKILRMMLQASPLLPIGEDLGVVPKEVRDCMKQMGIPGIKVMRWERRWDSDRSFLPLDEYPLCSASCVSTHDSSTLCGWWQSEKKEAMDFCAYKQWPYNERLSFEQLQQLLYDSHHTTSALHINLLQEYFALFPELVWPTPAEERINVPGTIDERNWSYRFKTPFEHWSKHAGLQNALGAILSR